MSKIPWTEMPGYKGETWNPTIGCTKVSAGCKNCYAEAMARCLVGMGQENYAAVMEGMKTTDGKRGTLHWSGNVMCLPGRLDIPSRWRDPHMVFVDSMSDLFHAKVSIGFIVQVFEVMGSCPRHIFQVLTKRPERMAGVMTEVLAKMKQYGWNGKPLPNVWLGVSVEDQDTAKERIPWLQSTPAALRLISYEPALENVIWPPLTGIDWMIIGGESGPRARVFDPEWARKAMYAADIQGLAVFMKQMGARCVKNPGTDYEQRIKHKHTKGGDMAEWPPYYRRREWPEIDNQGDE